MLNEFYMIFVSLKFTRFEQHLDPNIRIIYDSIITPITQCIFQDISIVPASDTSHCILHRH